MENRSPAVPVSRPETLRALAAALTSAWPFDDQATRLWSPAVEAAIERADAAAAVCELRAGLAAGRFTAAEAVLASLFCLDLPAPAADVTEALGAELAAALRADGWLVADPHAPDELRAVLSITAYDGLLLAADWGTLTRARPLPGDHVLGVGGAGRTLAALTPRAPVGLAADIGTGCGIHALLLARHARRVIATDISARALEITALNIGLNEAEGIELRAGSMLDPLDEPVDLLVANPPFVITPQGRTERFEYRDGGQTGDALIRELISALPAHLTPGGQAVLLANWEYPLPPDEVRAARTPGEDEPAGMLPPPLDWTGSADTSVYVIERELLDPVAYAETWIRDGGVARMSERWQADMCAWLDDFTTRGVGSIGFGWVRMHRLEAPAPPARHWARETGAPATQAGGLAALLDARLAVLEWLAGTSAEELAATAFIAAPDLIEHRHHTPGSAEPQAITLEQGTGFGRTITADTALAGFIGACDGTLTLAQIAAALAALLDVGAGELTEQLLAQTRRLLADGFIYPVL